MLILHTYRCMHILKGYYQQDFLLYLIMILMYIIYLLYYFPHKYRFLYLKQIFLNFKIIVF